MKTILKEYAKRLESKWMLNKNKLLSFVNTYLKNVKPQDLDTALANLPPDVIEKNIDQIDHVKNLLTLKKIENKYWPTETYSIIRTTSPAYMKSLSQYYNEATNEPNFKKYYNQEQWYINEQANNTKQQLETNKEFNLQELQQRQDFQEKQYQNTQEQIKKYTNYANQDYIQKLKWTNKQLDQAMQSATEVYWMRNLLNSWYYKQHANDVMNQWQQAEDTLKNNLNRTILDYQNRLSNAKDKYNYTMNNINTNKDRINTTTTQKENALQDSLNRNILDLNRNKFIEWTQIAWQKYQDELNKRRTQSMDVMNNIIKKNWFN